MHTILITGAGSGIGAATAKVLSQHEGFRLILLGRRLEPLEAVRQSCKRPENHVTVSKDVADADALVEWLSGAEADLSTHPLVGVFANAGIGGPNDFGPGDRWEEIIRINLTGTYNTLMACRPYLMASPTGAALVTSGVLARFGVPGQTAYVAEQNRTAWPGAFVGSGVVPSWRHGQRALPWLGGDGNGPSEHPGHGRRPRDLLRGVQGATGSFAACWKGEHARRDGAMGRFFVQRIGQRRCTAKGGHLHGASVGREQRLMDGLIE